LHGCVVDDYGELIGWDVVAAPDDEVSEVAAGGEELGAEVEVGEMDALVVGDAEAPVCGLGVGGGVVVREY
jgi:hypothetical protein